MATHRAKNLTLKEFEATKHAAAIEAVIGKLNGGSFMDCHRAFFEATGIWIPELVPVFQKLDAGIAFREAANPAG